MIYKSFFGLTESPFNLTPDPRFFFFSKKHEEALSHILLGIQERRGFIAITGEVGTGKTTLCRLLLQRVDPKVKTSLLFNANMGTIELLQAINQDFGLPANKKTKKGLVDELNRFLLDGLTRGENALLIIDEAQHLSIRAMEEIRLLSNLETEREKLLQILLMGQPELTEKLALNELRQLNQRITLRYDIPPLDHAETAEYIKTRLKAAGETDRTIWTPSATERIFRFSGGVPRLINVAADRAMMAAYVAETKVISEEIVLKGLSELPEMAESVSGSARIFSSFRSSLGERARGRLLRIGVALAALLLFFGGWFYLSPSFPLSPSFSSFSSGSAPATAPANDSARKEVDGRGEVPAGGSLKATLDPVRSDGGAGLSGGAGGAEESHPSSGSAGPVLPASSVSGDADPGGAGASAASDPVRAVAGAGSEPVATEKEKEIGSAAPSAADVAEGFDADGIYRVRSPEETRSAAYLTLLKLWGRAPAETPPLSSDPEEWTKTADLSEYRTPLSVARVSYLDYPILFQVSDPDGARYVVLSRLIGKTAVLLDPLFGQKAVAVAELQSRWVGEGVLFWEALKGVVDPLPERGEPVKQIQKLLSREGLFPAEGIDGILGPLTRQSILNFQTRVGLKPVGKFNTETHLVLARWVSEVPLPGLDQTKGP